MYQKTKPNQLLSRETFNQPTNYCQENNASEPQISVKEYIWYLVQYKMDEIMLGALLNVSSNQILRHHLILAFKCYAFLNWIKLPDISWFQMIIAYLVQILKGNSTRIPDAHDGPTSHDEEGPTSQDEEGPNGFPYYDVYDIIRWPIEYINPHVQHQANEADINPHVQHQANEMAIHIDAHTHRTNELEDSNSTHLWMLVLFLGSDGDLFSKCWAFSIYSVLLLMQHKSINDVFLYFFCLATCFLCDGMELIIDLYLLRGYFFTVMRCSSPSAILTVSMLAWCILPVDKLFLVLFRVYILSQMVPQRLYLIFSYFLASFQILIYHDALVLAIDITLEVLYESVKRTFWAYFCSLIIGIINWLHLLIVEWTNLNF